MYQVNHNIRESAKALTMVTTTRQIKSVYFGGVVSVATDEENDLNEIEPLWWTEDELFKSRDEELAHLRAGLRDYDWRGLERYRCEDGKACRRQTQHTRVSILRKARKLRKMAANGKCDHVVECSLQRFARRQSETDRTRALKVATQDAEEAQTIYESSSHELATLLVCHVSPAPGIEANTTSIGSKPSPVLHLVSC